MKPLAVSDLASFVFRHGDLYPSGGERSVETWEGAAAHSAMQKKRTNADANYQKEFSLKVPVRLLDQDWRLQGRIDGLTYCDGGDPVVEEYKTSRRSLPSLRGADEAQAWLYAGMLCQSDFNIPRVSTRVIYLNPEGDALRAYEHTLTRSQALLFLAFVLTCYGTFLQRIDERAKKRSTWAEDLSFPHEHFRKNQRAMAGQVYKSIVSGDNMLLEAATGSGKTLAVLFPALKAQAHDEQFFFLTSRNRGADAALNAAQLIAKDDAPLRVVQITAKEKTCPQTEMHCDASVCSNAAGYYSRLPAALASLEQLSIADRSTIESMAAEFSLCPFELSLDSAITADLVIADYNYVFDPSVRLQRFAYQAHRSLLIDEAHQLSNRINDMLSVEISSRDVYAALEEAPHEITESLLKLKAVMDLLHEDPRLRRGTQFVLDDTEALSTILRELLLRCDLVMGAARSFDGKTTKNLSYELPIGIERQTDSLFDANDLALSTLQPESRRFSAENANKLLPKNVLAVYFSALRWQRSQQWTKDEYYCHVVECPRTEAKPAGRGQNGPREEHAISIHRRCLDGSGFGRAVMDECRSIIRFSGTVSPLTLYQRLHGQPSNDAEDAGQSVTAMRASAPFTSEQIKVLTVTDIDTFYRRRLQSLPQLCDLIATLQRAHSGRYLVAMPSYEYLHHLAKSPHRPDNFIAQTPAMDEAQQLALLKKFRQASSAVLGIVMGGVFAESLDLGVGVVDGVVVVSLGLPPTDLIRSLSVNYFNSSHGSGWGEQVAYLQPALTRVVQAAGRVIRGPQDKGVICLVDPRFADPIITRFYPEYWRPENILMKDVESRLETFWSNDLSSSEY